MGVVEIDCAECADSGKSPGTPFEEAAFEKKYCTRASACRTAHRGDNSLAHTVLAFPTDMLQMFLYLPRSLSRRQCCRIGQPPPPPRPRREFSSILAHIDANSVPRPVSPEAPFSGRPEQPRVSVLNILIEFHPVLVYFLKSKTANVALYR